MEVEQSNPNGNGADISDGGGAAVLCCQCGVKIEPNQLNLCMPCLKGRVDITLGITKQVTIFFCRGCGRYQRPPWTTAELESRELLALCLKKIRGLNKVKLVDAKWVWTEPHSRRLKIKCSVQKEVFNNATVEQTFVVEFVVANLQCPDCQKSYTEHTWESVVQVRQKVRHKRTFFWLEQLLIKHNMAHNVINIRDQPDGLDFYFSSKSLGQHLVNFLESVVPIRHKFSKKLITQDDHSNTYRYKYTWCCEIAQVCRGDLVCLNKRMCASMGGISPLLLCYKVSNTVMMIDPVTMQRVQVNAKAYFRDPPLVACNRKMLREFVVVDIETPNDPDDEVKAGNFLQGEATLMRDEGGAKEDDENQYVCVTHLAHQLNAGDTCSGYDLRAANLGDDVVTRLRSRKGDMPEVVIVKKSFPNRKNRARTRKFKLKKLNKEGADGNNRKRDQDRMESDYEMFVNDLEEDPELRAEVNLYRRNDVKNAKKQEDGSDDEDDGFPEIDMSELIDEMSGNMRISEKKNLVVEDSKMMPPPS